MPTRKQRRRDLKSKRHQYEFVYLDAEGNELDEAPPELLEQEEQRKKERANGSPPAKKQAPRRGGRREPQPPSWNRALKRGLMLGGVIFALFALTSKGHYASVLPLAVLYTLLFVPFTYYIDRFAYKRFQARTAAGAAPTKKRKSP